MICPRKNGRLKEEGDAGDSGSSPPKKTRDSSPLRAGPGELCASCRASALKCCCVRVNNERAHQSSLSHAAGHVTGTPASHHLNANTTTARDPNLKSANVTPNSGNVKADEGHSNVDSGAAPVKRNASVDGISRSGRYSPIDLPKQRMTQALKGQGIVNHRGRAFIVSPVRPQIKGQPVDISSLNSITVKEENNSGTQTTLANTVPSISTTLDNVVSCKPNFDHKSSVILDTKSLKTPEPRCVEGSRIGMVTAVTKPLKNNFPKSTEDTVEITKTTGTLLNVPTYTPGFKVKKNKKMKERKHETTRKKHKLKKRDKKENADAHAGMTESRPKVKGRNSSPECGGGSAGSSGSSPEVTPGVRLPRHIMVARKSTRPHKPTRKVLEMVETSDILDPSIKHSPLKGDSKVCDSHCTNESTQTSPRESRSWNSGQSSRARDAAVSPELALGKIRTVPKKFTRTAVPNKGRLGDRATPLSCPSPSNSDIIVKRNAKKNLPVFIPTTSESESFSYPLKIDTLSSVTDVSTSMEKEAVSSTGDNEEKREVLKAKRPWNANQEPSNYSYPSDTEPHHILSCPDWREDLIKYKRERLHLPPKIISVPKHTKANFKVPTYVEIPKCNRLFTVAKKMKRSLPEPKSAIKLTITGPSVTVHDNPKGTSSHKPTDGTRSPAPLQKPVENTPKSPVRSVSNLAKILQHKKDAKLRSLRLNTKNLSPLMKKVHKELKRERHRIASCSGRGIGSPFSKSPVRSESPGTC